MTWWMCATVGTALLLGAATPSAAGERLPFGPGEECRFAVKYGFVRAGTATLEVHRVAGPRAGDHLLLVSTAASARFFSTFFKVEDRVESEWSVADRVPVSFRKRIREGRYEKDVAVQFDRAAGLARYASGDTMSIHPRAQDVLSAFYFVRTQDLVPGRVIEVPNHTDKKNYPLQVRVLRRETVKVEAGRFDCIVVEPMLESAGLFKQEGSLTIWLTDDARRIPVLMKSKVAVGSIAAELEFYRPGRPLLSPPPAGGRGASGE